MGRNRPVSNKCTTKDCHGLAKIDAPDPDLLRAIETNSLRLYCVNCDTFQYPAPELLVALRNEIVRKPLS